MLGLLLTGLSAGILSGLFGVGGGVILVPALLFVTGISIHQAIGVSLAVIVPTALTGVLKHYQLGNVDLKLAALVAVGGILGSLIGAYLASVLPAEALKKAFGVFLIFVGLNVVFGWTGSLATRFSNRDSISEPGNS